MVVERAEEKLRADWISHLGNTMPSEAMDVMINEMRSIVNNPQDPLEYLVSAIVERLDELEGKI